MRRSSSALIDSDFQILHCEENVLAYLRDTDAELILVIGSRGSEEQPAKALFVRDGGIPDGTVFREVLPDKA